LEIGQTGPFLANPGFDYSLNTKNMKTHRSAFSMAFVLLASLLILIPGESNAQHKKMSTEDLTQESTAILYGKCTKVKSEWNQENDLIFTTVTVTPTEYIKGNLGPEALITVPGGQVDDIIYEVSEMPVFAEGEEVFAFIWKHPSGKNLVTGGKQGKMKIEKDKNTGKKKLKGDPNKPEKVMLEDFTQKVKGYMK